MKRFHLLLVLLFSTFLMPNIAMACSKLADNKVGKEISHSMVDQHKSCCHKESDSGSDEKECSGDCEKSCCTCAATSPSTAFTQASQAIFTDGFFNYFLDTKSQFSFVSRDISNGFLSIWLIPKIG